MVRHCRVALGRSGSETIREEFEFRDVWQKNDARAQSDAVALWQASGALHESVSAGERAKLLCIAVYDSESLCALSTGYLQKMEIVRTTMAFFRIFIAPEYRERKIAIPLTYATYDAMHRYATAHPRLRIGGVAAVVTAEGHMGKPVTAADMVLVGYNKLDQPLILRWFEDFVL